MTDRFEQHTEAQPWEWSDLDALEKGIIATFSGRVGEQPGDLPPKDFQHSMVEAFPRMTDEDVVKTLGWSGFEGLRNVVAIKLQGLEALAIEGMAARLGELAGGTAGTVALAEQVGKDLQKLQPPYDTMPALQVLSELAMSHTAVTVA